MNSANLTLVILGIVLIAAVIVPDGIEAAGIKIPALKKLGQRAGVGILGLGALAVGLFVSFTSPSTSSPAAQTSSPATAGTASSNPATPSAPPAATSADASRTAAATAAAPTGSPAFSDIVGDGCEGSSEGVDYWPLNVTGNGWPGANGSLVANGCNGRFRWHTVDPSGSGQDTFTWQFDTGLRAAQCTAAAYIPVDAVHVDGTAVPYTADVGGTNVLGNPTSGGTTAATWTVDQSSAQGRWVTLGTFAVHGDANGIVNIIMSDPRSASAQYVAAGPMRLSCSV